MSAFIKQAYGLAGSILHWSPDAFWNATPFDVLDACYGYRTADDLSADDVKALRKLLNEKNHVL